MVKIIGGGVSAWSHVISLINFASRTDPFRMQLYAVEQFSRVLNRSLEYFEYIFTEQLTKMATKKSPDFYGPFWIFDM